MQSAKCLCLLTPSAWPLGRWVCLWRLQMHTPLSTRYGCHFCSSFVMDQRACSIFITIIASVCILFSLKNESIEVPSVLVHPFITKQWKYLTSISSCVSYVHWHWQIADENEENIKKVLGSLFKNHPWVDFPFKAVDHRVVPSEALPLPDRLVCLHLFDCGKLDIKWVQTSA